MCALWKETISAWRVVRREALKRQLKGRTGKWGGFGGLGLSSLEEEKIKVGCPSWVAMKVLTCLQKLGCSICFARNIHYQDVRNPGIAAAAAHSTVIQKRPFVRNSVCSQFLEGLFAILAECSQFCLRSF